MRRRSLLFALPVASACASGGLEAPNEVLIDEHWVSAGQPTRAGLLRLRSLGFDRVLYLAPSSVGDAIPDEPSLVRAQGLRFDHVPIPWATPELAHVDAVFAVLRDWPTAGRGLVHCQVNMRASVLVFLHRVLVRGHDPELAWTAVSKVWTPEGRWRALIAAALQRGGVRFEPI
ncbi:MAG: protein tyrosine phosphatase family protein [Inhella sp.]